MSTIMSTILALTLAVQGAHPGQAKPQVRLAPASFASSLETATSGANGAYARHAYYTAIVKKFGAVEPYASILNGTEFEVAALKLAFAQAKLKAPADTFFHSAVAPATLKECGQTALDMEKHSYNELSIAALAWSKNRTARSLFQGMADASLKAHQNALLWALRQGGSFTATDFAKVRKSILRQFRDTNNYGLGIHPHA